MSALAVPAPKTAGRPRSRRTERAILKAAGQLLAESGLAAMTMEAVAARAGVGKASIYRRWPSKGALAFDATLDEYLAGYPTRDTGSLEGDLLATARDWVEVFTRSPSGRIMRGLIAAVQNDPGLAGPWGERFVRPVRDRRRPIVERAIGRGEIAVASDPELILDMFFGPLYHRYLQGHLPLDDHFAIGVARMTAAAALAGAAAPRSNAGFAATGA